MTDTNVATVPQNKPRHVLWREMYDARDKELAAALPPDVSPARFKRALWTSAAINPAIFECSFSSVWLASMRACRDGLLPDGKEGAIVPYGSTAQWIPMIGGILKKVHKSNMFKWMGADIVHENEEFAHYVDENGVHFRHVPGDDDKAPVVKVYAAALTKTGGFYCAVLSMKEIAKIRTVSRATREDSPWKMWPEEMMKKTALRRLSKMLPFDVIEDDDLLGVGDTPALAHSRATPAPIAPPQRPRTAADALDQFANTPRSSVVGSESDGGEHPGIGPTDAEEATAVAPDPIAIAYEAGRRAKMVGMNRRAIPGEYRDPMRQREAMAWTAGFDDKPCPTWDDDHAE